MRNSPQQLPREICIFFVCQQTIAQVKLFSEHSYTLSDQNPIIVVKTRQL